MSNDDAVLPVDTTRTRRRLIRLGLIVLPLAIVVVLISPRWLPLLRSVLNEQRWNAEQISDYRIRVTMDDAWWINRDIELLVQNGRAVRCAGRTGVVISCPDYRVSDLFDLANKTSLDLLSCLKVEFDPSFHYPSRIDTSCSFVSDSGWTLRVTEFEPMTVVWKLPELLLLSAEAEFKAGKLTLAKELVAETFAAADAEFKKTESFKKLNGLAAQIEAHIEVKQKGYWVDGDTRLMWTTKDNGEDIDWHRASQYCEALTLGGHDNWRLPSIDELDGIHDPSLEKKAKGPLELPENWVWSGTMKGSSEAWNYVFYWDPRGSRPLDLSTNIRAFCVRVAE